MNKRLRTGVAVGAFLMLAAPLQAHAGSRASDKHGQKIERVLLISVDGMHAVDFANCSTGLSGVNSGNPYCPNLKQLAQTGVNYVDTATSKPSDSFPGLMALVTGGTPRTVGAYYDVAYDRFLAPPVNTTGNGVAGGTCTPGVANGTRTEYDEGIDLDQTQLNGGAPSGDGGINAIDPNKLTRDPNRNCDPVYPWNFIRTNTIFGVIHREGGYTAWSDKHASYAAVSGPGNNAGNLDDYFSPEINSVEVAMPQNEIMSCNPLPDNAAFMAGDDYTGSFQNIQCYDSLKVQAMLNEIDGRTHNGSAKAHVPNIFGMNFQAVSIGQKLIYQHGSVAPGYSVQGGYLDSIGTPSNSLLQEIEFIDNSIGMMVSELKKQRLYDSTMIVITAKHGQSPIDLARFFPIPGHSGLNGEPPSQIVASLLPSSETGGIGPTEDDVSLLWLTDSSQTANAVSMLEANAALAGIGQIFSGPTLSLVYNTPGLAPTGDPRTPDIIVAPNVGVVYTGSKKKDAEHGGFAHDDINVIMLVSNPRFQSATVTSPVETTQVAPTILAALGLDPQLLQAVQTEGTQVLPGLGF